MGTAEAADRPPRRGPPLIPLVLAVSLFMENMDSTVIATSLAAIAEDIHTDAIALKLALTSYLVALAIFIPVTGWMADRFGGRKVFQIALLVFIIGSIACALADSLLAFIGARFLQGMGGAMMSPLARIVLIRATPRSGLVSAMAWLSIPGLIGPIAGPPLGGFLTTYFSWHWIFIINVPIGLAGIWLTQLFLPEFERNAPRRMDFPGFVMLGTCFAGLVFGISVITLPALPLTFGILTLAAGVVAGLLYLMYMRRTEYPLLDMRLFRFPLFRAAVVGGSLFRLGFGATPFLLPLMLQMDFGLTAFGAGMLVFVSAFGSMGAKFSATWLYEKFGFRTLLTLSTCGVAVCIVAQGLFVSTTPVPLMVAVLIIFGVFQSTVFTGLNAFAVADISDRDAAQSTSITTVFSQLFLALGVAVGGGMLELGPALRGGGVEHVDFVLAFVVVGATTLAGAAVFFRVPADAGSQISGHRVGTAERVEQH
jgi:EmrB/QacA subfamily drug resistance transporter